MTVDPQLPRSAPEAQGIASQAILAFLDAAEEELQHLHSLMLVRHGAVVAEGWWAPYADAQAHSKLVARLGALMLPLPPGSPTSPDATISGERSYDLEPNQVGLEALRLHFSETGCAITLRDGAGDHTLRVGHGAWQEGETSLLAFGEVRPIAAAGAWQGAGRYQVQVLYVETPFCVTLSFQLNEERLLLDVAVNVSFGPTSYPQLVGHATHDP